jgi:hypothetical protein
MTKTPDAKPASRQKGNRDPAKGSIDQKPLTVTGLTPKIEYNVQYMNTLGWAFGRCPDC